MNPEYFEALKRDAIRIKASLGSIERAVGRLEKGDTDTDIELASIRAAARNLRLAGRRIERRKSE